MPALNEAMSAVHLTTSWVLLTLVGLHVAGVVQHAFRRDGIAARMALATRASPSGGAPDNLGEQRMGGAA